MLTGRVIGSGLASPATGTGLPYRLVIPDRATGNLAALAGVSLAWQATVREYARLAEQGKLSWDVVKRAQFSDNVVATAGEMLRLGACCVLAAETLTGTVLGIATYGSWGMAPTLEGGINLQAIDPRHLAGSPGKQQIRGIGTALVAGIAREFLADGVQSIYLHPLDAAAAAFWTHRGFGPCGHGGLMCLRGRVAIEQLIGSCQVRPDCPDRGDCLECGTDGATRPYARLEIANVPAQTGSPTKQPRQPAQPARSYQSVEDMMQKWTDADTDRALDVLFAEQDRARDVALLVLRELERLPKSDLTALPKLIDQLQHGDKTVVFEAPLLDIVGAIHAVWMDGWLVGATTPSRV